MAVRAVERGNAGILVRRDAASPLKHRIGTALMSGAGNAVASFDGGALGESSDEDLMSRVSQGDEAAFRRLASRHAARSFSLARRMAVNDSEAEDIVQEAMIRVWSHAPRWRPEAAFRTWLYRVVVNLCLNSRRQKVFASLENVDDPPDPSPSAAEHLARQQTDSLVARAIARLPERQRAAIVLTYYEGLGNADTAAVLDTTVSSVEALLVRAKRTLRDELGKTLDLAD
jgi:RNA polymerase sigma-70 factor, ECF subfamily